MIRSTVPLTLAVIAFVANAAVAQELKVEDDKENVVASRIEGDWQASASLNQRLTGREKGRPAKLSFQSDPSVASKVPAKYADYLTQQNLKVYLAGHVQLGEKECPFVLTTIHGNPHVIFWLERDGDPFGNGESFNVMLVVAEDQQNDLLFVGGDFNNQPFSAFERVKRESSE